MLSAIRIWTPSFWRLQAGGWILMYILLLLAALPRLAEPDILRYNTVACVLLFCSTLAIRPLCRIAGARFERSWFALEIYVLAAAIALGILVSFMTGLGTFGWTRLNGSNWTLSWLQCAMGIFLWCNLYIGIKQRMKSDASYSKSSPAGQESAAYATQFAIRTGSRTRVVSEREVLWISAARDYAEIHTRTGTFLLRETMQSLERRLDPERYVRIHRSRIVRWDQILELDGQDNREYVIKLQDGTELRSSRTYAPILENWLRQGRHQ